MLLQHSAITSLYKACTVTDTANACAVSIALSIPFTALNAVSTLIGIIIDVALIALIAVGWETLK